MMRKGFTLIELSIVLVIIGLLIGGILTAQSMVQTSKILKVNNEINQIKISIALFKSTFKCLPGDCATAQAIGLGFNGNGTGYIGPSSGPCKREQILIWSHLQHANMIDYKFPEPATDCDNVTELSMPRSSFDKLFFNMPPNEDYANLGNRIFLMGRATQTANAEVISSVDAQAIDSKVDDGMPNTGIVRVGFNNGYGATSKCINTGSVNNVALRYNTKNPEDRCMLQFFDIDNPS